MIQVKRYSSAITIYRKKKTAGLNYCILIAVCGNRWFFFQFSRTIRPNASSEMKSGRTVFDNTRTRVLSLVTRMYLRVGEHARLCWIIAHSSLVYFSSAPLSASTARLITTLYPLTEVLVQTRKRTRRSGLSTSLLNLPELQYLRSD